jgi:OmpA-OmpF porin, OOP family
VKGFKINIILVLFIVSFGQGTFGQITSLDELSPNQLKKFGKNAVRAGDFQTAIVFYERYCESRPNNKEVNYELANLQRQVRNYEKAKDLYFKIIKDADTKYPLARFYYAQMLKSTGDYDQAIEEFNKFKRSYKGNDDFKYYSTLVRGEINGCDSAKKIIQNPLNVTIEDLNSSVNGPHIELSPIPVNDTTLIYASLRVDSLVFFTNENADSAMPTRQFYLAKKEGMDWLGGKSLSSMPVNIKGVETGNGALSRDGRKFYFTRCLKNWQGKVICSIYLTEKTSDGWSKPEKLPLPVNDPNYTSTQPALGRTAQTNSEILYFVSDKPEGRGGLDIWYTVWNQKKKLFSKPKNAGSKINTAGDEMTPFYNLPTRTLYFSSTGLAGLGGYDIFSAFGERNKWTNVNNIGYPINSSYDDLYFTISPTGEFGFLVSNRPANASSNAPTCCDDIFSYRWNEFLRIFVSGTIYPFEKDKYGRNRDLSNFDFMNPDKSIKPMNRAVIALYMQDKETKEYVFMDRDTTGPDGVFLFNLSANQEYEFKMEGLQYFDSKEYLSTDNFDFSDTIKLPPIWVNVLTDKPVVLENVYYDFNSAELSQKSKNVLDTTILVMLKEAPEFIAEIGSHTDSIGGVEFNNNLSQQRANNVVSYLISKGISPARLIAKGYGSGSPVAPNTKPDGTDNPEGRERNRRTEFRIVGTVGAQAEEEDFEEGK